MGKSPAMHALFDDAGKFPGRPHPLRNRQLGADRAGPGKRVKAKGRQHPLKFDKPAPPSCWRRRDIAAGIELPLAWEFRPEDEFGFADLAREYFLPTAR